ncbi:MAG: 4Fe-4S dicluster domain-containing protein [Treponema sp.]
MLSLPVEKLNELFETVGSKENIYIPVDNTSGKADFKLWKKGVEMSKCLKTVRSAKDFFFPKTENLVNYKMNGQKIEMEDPRKELDNFVVFGVRACDAASFAIVDDVYIKQSPVDTYYKNRRDHGTVVTLACTEPAQTCFCKLYNIDASDPKGDVSSWIADGKIFFKPNTDKGSKFIDSVKSLLKDSDEKPVESQKKSTQEKISKLPFVNLDLSKFKGENMLKIFNSKVWDSLSEACLGCGTCTYVCPTCMCFDVKSFDTGDGIKQFRCWDSCMYSDFTKMAAANPRLTQKERFRQRFMHKLVYYPMDHKNVKSCVGCGRCLESCPIHMNIVKVIKTINETPLEEK